MKKFILPFFICFFSVYCFCQQKLSTSDWQSDLRFLQTTVHKDYPFLFKKTTAAQFDAAVEKLHQEIPNFQEHQIVAGLARMVASFEYGHTDIGWSQGPVKFHVLPINLYAFSDGVFVEGVHKDHSQILGGPTAES